jgi:ribosome-associated translation inhibitor RaiA
MTLPLQISFHGLEHSDAIEQRIRERAEKLARHYAKITSCRVTVESPHKHHHKGRVYQVKLVVTIPGSEIVVCHDADRHDHEDVYAAIRDAFESALRTLDDGVGKRRGDN